MECVCTVHSTFLYTKKYCTVVPLLLLYLQFAAMLYTVQYVPRGVVRFAHREMASPKKNSTAVRSLSISRVPVE